MKLQNQANGLKQFFTTTLFLVLFSLNTKADITTYNWQRELKGFSIEEIPGTSPTEYVAVGTVYYNTTINGAFVAEGVHFMHLGNTGNIICDKTFYVPSNPDEYSSIHAVDVAVENSNSFWVTMLYRGNDQALPNFDKDLITVANFDANCNFIVTPLWGHPMLGIECTDQHYQNLIPTHSLFDAGYLFISGYATPASEKYPAVPTRSTSDKVGFVLKVDIAAPPFGLSVVNAFEWDSPNTPVGSYDYDMPLRIKYSSTGLPPNILITGSANSNVDRESTILLYELDQNLGIQAGSTLHFGAMLHPNNPLGPVGIDIVDLNFGFNNEYYVLANHLDNNNYRYWSVTRVNKMNLIVTNSLVPATLMSPPSPCCDIKANGMLFDGTVYGEQADLACSATVASPHLNPSNTNFSPFLDFASYSYTHMAGITKTSSIHKVQLSLNGTEASYTGSGHFHDKFHRIFTSATSNKIISPVLNTSNNLQNAKFTSTNAIGDETDCEATYTECSRNFSTTTPTSNSHMLQPITLTYSTNIYFNLIDENMPTDENNCSGGLYKKGIVKNKNTTTIGNKTASKGIKTEKGIFMSTQLQNIISIYPNPAKDAAYVSFGLDESANIAVQVVDAFGRVVNTASEQQYEKGFHKITLNTENLSAGIYVIKIQKNNQSFTNQLTIIK